MLGMVFYAPLSTYYPLMTSDYFRADAWHAGAVNFAYAGGMMLCAVILGKFSAIKSKFPVIHLGLLGMGTASLTMRSAARGDALVQKTLNDRRVKALRIALALIEKERRCDDAD